MPTQSPGPVDPDVDLGDPAQRTETRPHQWDVLAAIAGGGVVGAEARYGMGELIPHAGAAFPWSTVVINAGGCLLLGVLMAVLLSLRRPPRLARPFLGVGILGGYTTFSTFAVDAERLLLHHRPGMALSYVLVTMAGCAAAVWLATTATAIVLRQREPAVPA